MQKLMSSSAVDNDPAFDALLANAMITRLRPQEFVYHSGSACDSFPIVLSGTVRVQLTSTSGRAVTLYRIDPGESCVVTTSCLLNGDNYPAEAIAESDVEAFVVPTDSFHKALGCSPGFQQYIFGGYSASLTNIIAKIEQLAFVSVDARLSSALLLIDENGENRVTHQELASELGTAREVISRRLKRFESEGWIRLARGQITVSDRAGLQRLSHTPLM